MTNTPPGVILKNNMDLLNLKNQLNEIEKQKSKIDRTLKIRQRWINYFDSKYKKTIKNCSKFLWLGSVLAFLSFLNLLFTNHYFTSSMLLILSNCSLITSAYQAYISKKFKRVITLLSKRSETIKNNLTNIKIEENAIDKLIDSLYKTNKIDTSVNNIIEYTTNKKSSNSNDLSL